MPGRDADNERIVVLTITARFPSLVQPWLVNQLIEIQRNGGENRILARTADRDVIPQNIRRFGLDQNCAYVPFGRKALFRDLIASCFRVSGLRSVIRGLLRLPRVMRSSELSFWEKLNALLLLKHMGMSDISVIHSHSEMAGSYLLPVVIALNVPLIVTFHGLPPVGVEPISERKRRAYTSVASAILLNTEFAKAQYVSLGAPEGKIRILPQGLRLLDFPFRHRVRNSDAPVELLSVGRFHPDKGQRYTLQAVQYLLKAGHNVLLHLVGNGPERPALEAYADELMIGDVVRFYSKLSDEELGALYSRSHIFVLASVKSKDRFHEETQGVVLQEAQASGLITIATATGGIPECIDDGVAGFLVEDRSADQLAEKIGFVMSNEDQWQVWQDASLKWVQQNFAVEVIGKKTWSVYGQVLSNLGARGVR